MADKGTTRKSGIIRPKAKAKGAGQDWLRNFVAFEYSPTDTVTLVMVAGQVKVPNPGVIARLSLLLDENPDILLLRLDLKQRQGVWPQVETWVDAEYARALVDDGPFDRAEIIYGEVIVLRVPFVRG